MRRTILIFQVAILWLGGFFGSAQTATNISEVTYEQAKKLFENDPSPSDVRISSFSATEVKLVYKGRYLTYRLNEIAEPQRSRIESLVAIEKERRLEQAAKDNEEAARRGMLRDVNGVVHNLLKPSAAWVKFSDARVFQKIEDALLLDISKDRNKLDLIYVVNLPQFKQVADGDKVSFMAIQDGTFSYTTKGNDDRTIRRYDCGVLPGGAKKPSLVRSPTNRTGESALDPAWDSSGTGFFVTEDGYLVTCYHVVEHGKRFAVKTSAGTLTAQVVASDPTNDLAVLKVSGKFSTLAINTNEVKRGDSAFTIGFPNISLQGLSPKYTDGKISSLSGLHDDDVELQISVPVQPGNSGGPLADANGNVIGVVVARLNDYAALKRTRSIPQNVNYAVKIRPLLALLRSANLTEKVRFLASESSRAAVENVEKATGIVLVSE